MADTLNVGDPVQDFTLTDTSGAAHSSADARREGLLMFVFWKQSCGTCQYAMPFLQRFQDQYADTRFRIWGIAQESAEDAAAFAERFGATFPQLVDDGLQVTEQYHLVSVPTFYLVDSAGRILRHAPAFVADEYNAVARMAADVTGRSYVPVVRPEDDAPAIKPG